MCVARRGLKQFRRSEHHRVYAVCSCMFFGRENCGGGVEEGHSRALVGQCTRERHLSLALRDPTPPTSSSLHHGCYPFGREREGSCSRHPPQFSFSVCLLKNALTSFPSLSFPFILFFTSLPFLYRVAGSTHTTRTHTRAQERRGNYAHDGAHR